jgi:hypothetical protein
MKRTAITMILAFCIVACLPKQLLAGDSPDYELIKGQVVDVDGDGKWDELYFSVKTKNAKLDIPVKYVNISKIEGLSNRNVPFKKIEINKRLDEYVVDLSGLNMTGNFLVEIVLDTSALAKDKGDVVDGGPGPDPNETVLILEYP